MFLAGCQLIGAKRVQDFQPVSRRLEWKFCRIIKYWNHERGDKCNYNSCASCGRLGETFARHKTCL